MSASASWISSAVNYQINVRAMAFREPRNVFEALAETPSKETSFDYIASRLDALKALGITILHIMPPFVMGRLGRKGIGSPYAARNYHDVDPEYGTLAQMKNLVRKAHESGFKVIIGMVPNHTSRDHVWIESHPEYYVQNERGEIIYDLDWSDTAKLDYTKPGLRQAMFDVYDFWLSLLGTGPDGRPDGVDGFRIDMAHFINDRTFWDDTIPVLVRKYAHKELLFLAECYGIDNSMDLFRRGFNASYDDAYYKLLEHYLGTDYEGHSRLFTAERHPGRTEHSPHFATFKKAGYAGAVRELLTQYEQLLPQIPHPVYLARYTDNHDEGRGIYRFGPEATQAMMQLLCLTNHCIPFLLAGQEFGAANRPSIHNRFGCCDKGREVEAADRIFFQDGIEWEGNSFIRTPEARRRVFEFYRQLLEMRRQHPALRTGSFRFADVQEQEPAPRHTLVAIERELDGERIRGLVNLGHEPRTFANTGWLNGKILLGQISQPGQIAPFSAVVAQISA